MKRKNEPKSRRGFFILQIPTDGLFLKNEKLVDSNGIQLAVNMLRIWPTKAIALKRKKEIYLHPGDTVAVLPIEYREVTRDEIQRIAERNKP